MIDAQSRSSLKQMVCSARLGATELSRFLTSYLGLILLVAIGVASTLPDLRAQVRDFHSTLVEAPVPTTDVPNLEVAAVPALDPSAHARTVAFLESMGDGEAAEKLPPGKATPAQVEALRRYITRKYRVSNEATRMLISTAYGVGQEMNVDPLLLLAVIAIESSFNPFAESQVGAQGLMQVLTKVHMDKFATFGGEQAAWNPVANIHVGALILKDCIVRGGSLVAGLRMYAGAAGESNPYGDRVLAERRRLASAAGVSLPPVGPAPVKTLRAAVEDAAAPEAAVPVTQVATANGSVM
jgi:soluble lytic murein transglycosylase-like protein